MNKTIDFDRVLFDADTLVEAREALASTAPERTTVRFPEMIVTDGRESTDFDTESEFIAAIRRPHDKLEFTVHAGIGHRLYVRTSLGKSTHVSVEAARAEDVETVLNVFRAAEPTATHVPLSPPEPPTVFVGHGRDPAWRDLKDHLQDQHGYDVMAYEVGARAGHVIRDILQDMLGQSSFAILVMTGEDEMADGAMRPRENVVHETGLFQGQLGFAKAIVLVEQGVEPFSNLQGVHQIRFGRGNIRETFGDVLATLRREFGETDST